jgi:hypothetical protein
MLSLVQGMEILTASAKGWASPPVMVSKRGLKSAEPMEGLWECRWDGSMETLWEIQWEIQWEIPMAAVMD